MRSGWFSDRWRCDSGWVKPGIQYRSPASFEATSHLKILVDKYYIIYMMLIKIYSSPWALPLSRHRRDAAASASIVGHEENHSPCCRMVTALPSKRSKVKHSILLPLTISSIKSNRDAKVDAPYEVIQNGLFLSSLLTWNDRIPQYFHPCLRAPFPHVRTFCRKANIVSSQFSVTLRPEKKHAGSK